MLRKLSSGQGRPSNKRIFGHVTSLIGKNLIAAYSDKVTGLLHTPAKYEKNPPYDCSYCEKKMRIRQSRFSHIQTIIKNNTKFFSTSSSNIASYLFICTRFIVSARNMSHKRDKLRTLSDTISKLRKKIKTSQ